MLKKELGIYVHIPFCKQKCYYCDFVSFANRQSQMKDYIEALKKEIEQYELENYNVTTIYIGGGTPSYVDSKEIANVLNIIKQKMSKNETKFENIEVTIEVNPGTVTKQKLESYKEAGINRISIGLQTTNNELLKEIGRIHTYEQFLETYQMIKEVGFKNCNVDLMLGLPNQNIQDLKKSLQEVINLGPSHISVYSLIVEEGTPIDRMIEAGTLELPDEELERQMYWYVKNTLELNGYKHYEISNFAKEGKESKHNLNCWNQEEYIGIGLAAHSYLDKIRYSNTADLKEYIKNVQNDNIDKIRNIEEKQIVDEQKNEYMMLGFRKLEGVSIAKFKEKFGENPVFVYRHELNKLVEAGLIEVDLNYIKLTNKGLDLANLVFEEFI